MIKIQSTKQNLMKFAVKPLAQLLIDAAKRRSFITYGEAKQLLETEAGFDTIFTLMVGFPAGVLNNRFLAARRDCPPLSILLVRQKDHLPGVGAGNFMAKHLQWNELSNRDFKVNRPEEWRSACDRIATDIYKFRDWEQVYRKAFGESLPTFPSSRSTKSKEKDGVKYKRKGEGKNHKDLRLWVKCNPGKLNSTYASFDTETEFRLDSGDRVDVVYFGQDLTVAIEVKSKDSDDSRHQARSLPMHQIPRSPAGYGHALVYQCCCYSGNPKGCDRSFEGPSQQTQYPKFQSSKDFD